MAKTTAEILGQILTLLGWDGTEFRNVAVDSSGRLQVVGVTMPLPSGAATAANQLTEITALQLIDDLRTALASVATDQLRADVITSALPTGAATATNQATMITALQLIDDLRNALAAVATDQLRADVITSALPTGAATAANQATMIAKFPDRAFTYQGIVTGQVVNSDTIAGNVALTSSAVPAGRVWVITAISAMNVISGNTRIQTGAVHDGGYALFQCVPNTVVYQMVVWGGQLFLDVADVITAIFTGCTLHDDIRLYYSGYAMTVT